jgi:hypothetical protein
MVIVEATVGFMGELFSLARFSSQKLILVRQYWGRG